jgi:hypothetical protein
LIEISHPLRNGWFLPATLIRPPHFAKAMADKSGTLFHPHGRRKFEKSLASFREADMNRKESEEVPG